MNTIKTLIVLPLIFMAGIISAQSDGKIFIDFGDEKITADEFKRVYTKNNSGEMVTKSTVEEYLDLYINFKLKVKEAEARGMDTISSFVKELAGYRRQLAKPYLSAEGIIEDLKREGYARLKQDVRASHILIKSSYQDSPEDTLKAYEKAVRVKKMVEGNKDFDEIARQYSDDPSAKSNGGDLGYFTAFYMVYPFETAAYKTKVGEISKIVRSQFGYHIVKVNDKRPAVGNIKVAHILISSDPELSKTDDPEGKIKEIYDKLKNGEPFESLAKQFSDDKSSIRRGGELSMFGVGRMVPEFEKVAFSLENDGDISEPFKTQYGWHIVKRIMKSGIGTYEELESELTRKVKKDSRSNLSENAVVKNIMNQYGFEENLKERDDFYAVLDSTYFKGKWSADKAAKLNKTLFTIGDKKYNQMDFANYLEANQRLSRALDFRVVVNMTYASYKKSEILAYKNSRLDKEYPEFRALMEEYHDGILLFNLTDELVWSKASKDTTGLEEFYEKNKENYMWKKRVDAVVFSVLDKKIGKQVQDMIKEGIPIKELTEKLNRSSQLNVKYEIKKYEKGDNEFVDQVDWKQGFSDYIVDYNRYRLVYIKEVIEPTYKTTTDARGLITSDYQVYLEEKWVKELRNKYKYTIDDEVLKSLKAELN